MDFGDFYDGSDCMDLLREGLCYPGVLLQSMEVAFSVTMFSWVVCAKVASNVAPREWYIVMRRSILFPLPLGAFTAVFH